MRGLGRGAGVGYGVIAIVGTGSGSSLSVFRRLDTSVQGSQAVAFWSRLSMSSGFLSLFFLFPVLVPSVYLKQRVLVWAAVTKAAETQSATANIFFS